MERRDCGSSTARRRPIEVLVLKGHKDGVGSGVFASGGSTIVTAGDDARVRVWRPRWTVIEKPLPGAASVAFTPDGRRVWVGVNDETTDERGRSGWTGEFDAGTMTELKKSSSLPGHFVGPIWSTSRSAGELRVRNALSTSPATTLAGSGERRHRATWSRPAMAASCWWHLAPRGSGILAVPTRPPDPIATPSGCKVMAISNDKRIAWYCAGKDQIMIGRAGQYTPVTIPIADRTNATAMQFSTSGRWLAVNFQDRSVRLFDGNSGAITLRPARSR